MRLRLLWILFGLPTVAASQTTLHVPSGEPTIQAAIEAAADGDTVLVAPGVYAENVDFLGKAITVRSEQGAATTIIDATTQFGWPNGPGACAVVRMINGEGPDTVLEGLTITGGHGSSGTGVQCAGLSPTIRDCVITGNSTQGHGGGVNGDPLLERCTISNNTSGLVGYAGGGVYGAPTMIDCVVTRNRSGARGGGLYATDSCTVVNTIFDSNIGGNGLDGYEGGGVYGPATLIRCQITRNVAHHYFTSDGAEYEIGTGVDSVAVLKGCTVAFNVSGDGELGLTSGVRNVGLVEDSIVWGNQGEQVSTAFPSTVLFSIVGGGHPGLGNLALDPLFEDPDAGDYSLLPGSPAIDAGNPASPPDPDGTIADMGAIAFPQYPAGVVVQNGTGVNPECFWTQLDPVIGAPWSASVDATAHGFAASHVVFLGYAALSTPLPLGFGELLVDGLSPQLFVSVVPVVGGVAALTLPVPGDYALGGLKVYAQAVVADAVGSLGLCNALELTLGL